MTETPTDHDLLRIFCLLRLLTNDLVQNSAELEPRAVQVFVALENQLSAPKKEKFRGSRASKVALENRMLERSSLLRVVARTPDLLTRRPWFQKIYKLSKYEYY